jgi:iron(III) transport system ATP-binding protein
MNPRFLAVDDVTKRFGSVVAVDHVTFELGDHELLALVGPSGCGKSTLLRVIGGIHTADSGRIELGGEVIDDGRRSQPPERRRIGLVFQDHALFPHLDVAANVGFGVRDASERPRRVDEMLELVGLGGYGRRFPHELSGGERQRVALGRALAQRPALMLLDEPFASLDPNLRSRIRDDVVEILRAARTPAVFVTHDQHDALAIGHRVAMMQHGRIIQIGTPHAVYHRPTSRFVATFMGDADFLDRADVELLGQPLAERNARATFMVRPDDVAVEVASHDDDHEAADPDAGQLHPGRSHAAATVVASEFRGSTWCYTARFPSGTTVRAIQPHYDVIPIGSRVTVTLRPGHAARPSDDDTDPRVSSPGEPDA